tara:strand:- start:11086 stop:11217 length:132 start_codon:yes stop_codon:yes gene_type:complete
MASIEDWVMALGALILLPFALIVLIVMTVLWGILKLLLWFMGK